MYSKWENFSKVVKRAMLACKNSGYAVEDHFPEVRKMAEMGTALPEDLPTPEKSIQIRNDFKRKGRDKNNKLGQSGCELDTVVGAIAYRYSVENIGGSVYDPVFALASILEWAGICENERGYLVLK